MELFRIQEDAKPVHQSKSTFGCGRLALKLKGLSLVDLAMVSLNFVSTTEIRRSLVAVAGCIGIQLAAIRVQCNTLGTA
jgi:hypothetical protein